MKPFSSLSYVFISKWASKKHSVQSHCFHPATLITFFICINKGNSKQFLFIVFVSFPASKNKPPYHLLLIHLTRTQGSSNSRNIYSNPSAVQWPVCLAASPHAFAKMHMQTVWANLWTRRIKDFRVPGKSIKIACSSHGLWSFQLIPARHAKVHRNSGTWRSCKDFPRVEGCIFIVVWVMFANAVQIYAQIQWMLIMRECPHLSSVFVKIVYVWWLHP